MAAKFGFKITAKDDTKKGTDSAEDNMEKLGKAGDKAGKVLKAAFVGFSLAKVVGELKKTVTLFGEQEKAELRLVAAARNNPYINGDAVKGLKDYASGLQEISVFGDEAIIQQQAFLTTLGMTEEQINGVLDAAVNLASTGIVSLDSAVKNISKTYAGMSGELGELLPQLRELTAEELKSGAAVELISEQYAGMAAAAAAGVSGTQTQIKNMLGDMQESIGAALAPIVKKSLEAIRPIIQNLIDWFTVHQNQMTNFFIHFPDIVGASLSLIAGMMQEAFSFDTIMENWGSMLEHQERTIKNLFVAIGNIVSALGVSIWEPLKTGFEWIVFGIKRLWQEGVFEIIDIINGMISPINTMIGWIETMINNVKLGAVTMAAFFKHPLDEAKRLAAFYEMIDKTETTRLGGVGSISVPAMETLTRPSIDADGIAAAWSKAIKGIPAFASANWDSVKTLAVDIGSRFSDLTAGFSDKIGEILGRELDDKIKSPVLALVDGLEDQTEDIVDAIRVAGAGGAGGVQLDPGALGTTPGSQLGQRLGEIFSKLGTFGESLGQVIGSVAGVMALMDPLTTIINSFANSIAGPLNKALAPLVGILVALGQIIGGILVPILNLFAPVLQGLAEIFVWLYNKVLKPIGQAIIFVFTIVYDIVAGFANVILSILNGLIGIVNLIPGINIPTLGMLAAADPATTAASLQDISLASVTAGGEAYIGEDTMTAGSGASITGGHDVTINFQITTDVLVGDRRELVEWISDEVRTALELGTVVA